MDIKDRRIQELEHENAELKATVVRLKLYVTELLARIEELEQRLALNSSNSSKPPSSESRRHLTDYAKNQKTGRFAKLTKTSLVAK